LFALAVAVPVVVLSLSWGAVQAYAQNCPNLVINGDFEQGSTGFNTEYQNLGTNQGNTHGH